MSTPDAAGAKDDAPYRDELLDLYKVAVEVSVSGAAELGSYEVLARL